MNELIAKPVVKNKMWIVESYIGNKIGNIMVVDEGGVVYIHDDQREKFPSIKILSEKYNITFAKAEKQPVEKPEHEVYGYPTTGKSYNVVLDVQRYLPIFTKQLKSKSFFCAGHYLVNMDGEWSLQFCPKLILLNRYAYQGPFQTKERATAALGETNAL